MLGATRSLEGRVATFGAGDLSGLSELGLDQCFLVCDPASSHMPPP